MGQAVYYATMGICIFGCISRILLAGYYQIFLHALRAAKSTKNKGMLQLKEKFIVRYQAMLGVRNVEYFLERFFHEKKFFLFPLPVWNAIHIRLVSACLLLGTADALYQSVSGAMETEVAAAMFQGIWTGAFLLIIDGCCMISAKWEALTDGLCDYLENCLKVQLEHEYKIWGKNSEENRQTKQVADAWLRVVDEPEYRRMKRTQAKQTKKTEKQKRKNTTKVQKDIELLKREVAERRQKEAELAAAATVETEKEQSRQLEELLKELAMYVQ